MHAKDVLGRSGESEQSVSPRIIRAWLCGAFGCFRTCQGRDEFYVAAQLIRSLWCNSGRYVAFLAPLMHTMHHLVRGCEYFTAGGESDGGEAGARCRWRVADTWPGDTSCRSRGSDAASG